MPAQRPPYISVMLLSASALAYEILLMRLFSIVQWHHFAYLFIGLALLGYGISGAIVTLRQHRLLPVFSGLYVSCITVYAVSALVCFGLAQLLPFTPQAILWDSQQVLYLIGIFLLLTIPFFFAATALCLVFLRFGSIASRIYAMDLGGAGIGSLGILILLYYLFPQKALMLVALTAIAAAFIAVIELNMRWCRRVIIGLSVALALVVLFGGTLRLQLSPYKGLEQVLRIEGAHIIAQRSSPMGLLSVVAGGNIPLRYAPGLSLTASQEPLPQLGVFTDGDNMTVLTQQPTDQKQLGYLDQMTTAVPYHLQAINKVLVIGVGGGMDILQARFHHSRQIDGVELNAQMLQLLSKDFAEYTGKLARQPGVHLYHAEVRDFLARHQARYQLIQLALVDAFNASVAGLYALNESYLYTLEALQQYMRHLEPNGYLAMTRWIRLPPRDSLKLFATAVAVLERSGIKDADQRLLMIRSWQTSTLLVKNGRFTEQELAAVRTFCEERAFDLAYAPGLQVQQSNRYNILRQPVFFEAATALLGPERENFIRQYKFNLRPATDDRPYFHQFFKWSSLGEIFRLREQGGMSLLEWGYLILVVMLVIAVFFSLALILFPIWWYQRIQSPPATTIRAAQVVYYFFAIGLAFLFIEIAFMQKFVRFLHHPINSIAVSLTAFLIFAGLGSYLSGRFSKRIAAQRVLVYALSGLVIISIVYLWQLDNVFQALAGSAQYNKLGLSILLIAPLAVCMGMPFPLALAKLAERARHYLPWAWGINGCASVISAVLATLLAIHLGFSAVILLALLLYITVIWVFPK
jgi:spermidine synthase